MRTIRAAYLSIVFFNGKYQITYFTVKNQLLKADLNTQSPAGLYFAYYFLCVNVGVVNHDKI